MVTIIMVMGMVMVTVPMAIAYHGHGNPCHGHDNRLLVVTVPMVVGFVLFKQFFISA